MENTGCPYCNNLTCSRTDTECQPADFDPKYDGLDFVWQTCLEWGEIVGKINFKNYKKKHPDCDFENWDVFKKSKDSK